MIDCCYFAILCHRSRFRTRNAQEVELLLVGFLSDHGAKVVNVLGVGKDFP